MADAKHRRPKRTAAAGRLWPPSRARGEGRAVAASADSTMNHRANLLRRLLRHRGLGAGDRSTPHVARLRLIVTANAVHGLAVIPHHEVVHRPFVDMDELPL